MQWIHHTTAFYRVGLVRMRKLFAYIHKGSVSFPLERFLPPSNCPWHLTQENSFCGPRGKTDMRRRLPLLWPKLMPSLYPWNFLPIASKWGIYSSISRKWPRVHSTAQNDGINIHQPRCQNRGQYSNGIWNHWMRRFLHHLKFAIHFSCHKEKDL